MPNRDRHKQNNDDRARRIHGDWDEKRRAGVKRDHGYREHFGEDRDERDPRDPRERGRGRRGW